MADVAGYADRYAGQCAFNEHIERVAFKVELVDRGNGSKSLQWTGITDGKKVVFNSEPYAGFWKIVGVNMMRLLPIDSML
jgi:hypothetical protein